MSDSLRARGQEVQLRVTLNGQIQSTFVAIENLTITPQIEKLQKGYLGNSSDSLDEIFKGCAFDFSMDPIGCEMFKLIDTIIDRAARRTAQSASHINIIATFNFPNGQRIRWTLPDVKFENIPVSVGGRDQYVNGKFSGACEGKPLLAGV